MDDNESNLQKRSMYDTIEREKKKGKKRERERKKVHMYRKYVQMSEKV